MYGLEESVFTGLLDNSPLKATGKRLYGTSLHCRAPHEVVGKPRAKGLPPLRVFINIGGYNGEVCAQLKKIDPELDCILL